MLLTMTDVSFFNWPMGHPENRENILLNYSHFPVTHISICFHFMPYLLPPYNYHANNVLTVTPFLSRNSLVNINPYLLLINPLLKPPLFLFINYSHTQKLGEHGRPPFDATEASIIKTIGSKWCCCMCRLVCLIFLSICGTHRSSCISITALHFLTDFTQWIWILLSQHNWWRHPMVLMPAPNFAFSVTCQQFHACACVAYPKCTHLCLLAALFWLSFSTSISNLNRPLTWVKTSDMYLFFFIKTQTHTHTFIHLLMCSVTLTWGWLPSCASCFFHQHVFTSRGPLCLHYREAINRKVGPGVLKLPLLWEGRALRRSEP